MHWSVDAALLLAALFICFPAWFDMRVCSNGADFYALLLPHHYLNRQAWLSGVAPLWNPFVFCGSPLAATMQSSSLYPFTAWSVFSDDILAGLKAFRLFHVWLFGWLTLLWLRLYHRHARWAAMAGALAAMASLYVCGHRDQVNQLATLTWLPAALWSMQAMLRRIESAGGADLAWRRALRPALLLAACFALQALAGSPQFAFYTQLACLGILLFWAYNGSKKHKLKHCHYLSAAALFIGAAALGAMLAAIQLIPARELSALSVRLLDGFSYAAFKSVTPDQLPRLFFYNPFGGFELPHDEFGGFWIGWSAMALIALGLIAGGLRRRAAYGLFAAWALLILLALGYYTPLYRIFYTVFWPLARHFRVPARVLCLTLPILAYLLSSALQSIPARSSRWQTAVAMLFILALLAERAWYFNAPAMRETATQIHARNPWLNALTDASPAGAPAFEEYITDPGGAENTLRQLQQDCGVAQRVWRLMPEDSNICALSTTRHYTNLADVRAFEQQAGIAMESAATRSEAFPDWRAGAPRIVLSPAKHRAMPNLNAILGLQEIDGYEEGLSPTLRYLDFMLEFNRAMRPLPHRELMRLLGVGKIMYEYPLPQEIPFGRPVPLPLRDLSQQEAWGRIVDMPDSRPIAQWIEAIDARIDLRHIDGPMRRSQGKRPPRVEPGAVGGEPLLKISKYNNVSYMDAAPDRPWGLLPEEWKIDGEAALPAQRPAHEELRLAVSQAPRIERPDLNRLRMDWDAPLERGRWMWISQQPYSGWRARTLVHGAWRETDLRSVCAIGNLAACPKGAEALELSFEPDSFRAGLFITLMALAAWLALIILPPPRVTTNCARVQSG